MRKLRLVICSVLTAVALCLLAGCSPSANDSIGSIKESAHPLRVMVSTLDIDSAEPSIAVDATGNLYVAYVEHAADKSADIYIRKYDGEFGPIGEKVRINPTSGQVRAWQGDQPTIQIAPDGTIYVGWNLLVKNETRAGNDLMLSVSSDGGKTFATPVKVNDDSVPASHGMHGLAINGDTVYVAWLDERYLIKQSKSAGASHHKGVEPDAELYFAVSNNGGKTFSANKKIGSQICPCCKVQTALDASGKLYISWRQVLDGNLRHIAVASTADGGKTFTERTIVSDDKWEMNACPVSGAPMLVGDDGRLNIAWFTAGEAGEPGLYFAESTDGAKSFTPRRLLTPGTVLGTSVMLTDPQKKLKVIGNISGKMFMAYVHVGEDRIGAGEIDFGESPAAVTAGGHVYIAYIAQDESKKRYVWVMRWPT